MVSPIPCSAFLYLQFLARCHPYILLHFVSLIFAAMGMANNTLVLTLRPEFYVLRFFKMTLRFRTIASASVHWSSLVPRPFFAGEGKKRFSSPPQKRPGNEANIGLVVNALDS